MTALDPHRTLGLAEGASQAEIKRAYRHLAKLYHPDSAGERALPRFLAIQAAYEALVAEPGRPRPAGRSGARPTPPTPAWQADASRARATREAYRARNRRGTAGASGGSGAGPAGTASGPNAAQGSGAGPGASSSGARSGRASRRPKATIGSTSYDGADKEPFDPAWAGATWYGAGSGTYWTINPKEYADPRKHGPEYLARSRRATSASRSANGQAGTDDQDGATATDDDPTAPPPGAPAASAREAAPGSAAPDSASDPSATGPRPATRRPGRRGRPAPAGPVSPPGSASSRPPGPVGSTASPPSSAAGERRPRPQVDPPGDRRHAGRPADGTAQPDSSAEVDSTAQTADPAQPAGSAAPARVPGAPFEGSDASADQPTRRPALSERLVGIGRAVRGRVHGPARDGRRVR